MLPKTWRAKFLAGINQRVHVHCDLSSGHTSPLAFRVQGMWMEKLCKIVKVAGRLDPCKTQNKNISFIYLFIFTSAFNLCILFCFY